MKWMGEMTGRMAGKWQTAHSCNEKRPEERHLLGLAGSCWTDGEQRELELLIGVRGGATRCF
jgi:hypothetical protein